MSKARKYLAENLISMPVYINNRCLLAARCRDQKQTGLTSRMGKKKDTKIIIEGVTEEGQKFRPSDWAERMSGSLSSFRNRRINYSPLLQPVMRDGKQCVQLDPALKQSNPELYNTIIEFASSNKLRVSTTSEPEDDSDTEQ